MSSFRRVTWPIIVTALTVLAACSSGSDAGTTNAAVTAPYAASAATQTPSTSSATVTITPTVTVTPATTVTPTITVTPAEVTVTATSTATATTATAAATTVTAATTVAAPTPTVTTTSTIGGSSPDWCYKVFTGSNGDSIMGDYQQLLQDGQPVVNIHWAGGQTDFVSYWLPQGGIKLRTNLSNNQSINGSWRRNNGGGTYAAFEYVQGLAPDDTTATEWKEFYPAVAGDTSYEYGFPALEGNKPGGGLTEQQAAMNLYHAFPEYYPHVGKNAC